MRQQSFLYMFHGKILRGTIARLKCNRVERGKFEEQTFKYSHKSFFFFSIFRFNVLSRSLEK